MNPIERSLKEKTTNINYQLQRDVDYPFWNVKKALINTFLVNYSYFTFLITPYLSDGDCRQAGFCERNILFYKNARAKKEKVEEIIFCWFYLELLRTYEYLVPSLFIP